MIKWNLILKWKTWIDKNKYQTNNATTYPFQTACICSHLRLQIQINFEVQCIKEPSVDTWYVIQRGNLKYFLITVK